MFTFALLLGSSGNQVEWSCVTGGIGNDGSPLDSTECYNTTSNSWQVFNCLYLPTPSHSMTAINLGSVACVAGGIADPYAVYCTDGSNWTKVVSLPSPRVAAAIIYYHYSSEFDRVIIAGGSYEPTSWNAFLNGGASPGNFDRGASGAYIPSNAVTVHINGESCLVGNSSGGPCDTNTLGDYDCSTTCRNGDGGFYTFHSPGNYSFRYGGATSLFLPLPLLSWCVVGGRDVGPFNSSVQCFNEANQRWESQLISIQGLSSEIQEQLSGTLAFAVNISIATSDGALNSSQGLPCVVGGQLGSGSPTGLMLCVTPSSDISGYSWINHSSLTIPRYRHSSFILTLGQSEMDPSQLKAPLACSAPTPTPTTAPTTATPTSAPTTAKPTIAPTAKPTTAPTTAPTMSPSTISPTISPTSPIAPTSVVLYLDFFDSSFSGANATARVQVLLPLLFKLLNLTTQQQSQVTITNVTSSQGTIHVSLSIGSQEVKGKLMSANGVVVDGARVSIEFPSLLRNLLQMPVWVPIVILAALLFMLVIILWLSRRMNPRAKVLPLFGFISHVFSLCLHIWAAYSLHAIQLLRADLTSYYIAYLCALFTPVIPNLLGTTYIYRVVIRASGPREWLHKNLPLISVVAFVAAFTNTRIFSLLGSGSFGIPAFCGPVEPHVRRILQASGIIGVVSGDLPRALIQALVILISRDSSTFVAVGLPMFVSLAIVFLTSLQTCYMVAYARKDIK